MRVPVRLAIPLALLTLSGAGYLGCTSEQDGLVWTGDGDTEGKADGETGSYEYIIVGSGAGGGPLAANLAIGGHSVLLLEAGDDQGGQDPKDKSKPFNVTYQVPALHTQSTENAAMRWDYFVDHYADQTQAALDSKKTAEGVLYPRAGTLGGCTSHNAMITIYPHASDWDYIANLTKDSTWSAANMRDTYFRRVEHAKYLLPLQAQIQHRDRGWLSVQTTDITLGLPDLFRIPKIIASVDQTIGLSNNHLLADLNNAGDDRDQTEGSYVIPLAIDGKQRNGTRERIVSIRDDRRYKLKVHMNALVTRVIFDPSRGVNDKGVRDQLIARGVEFIDGAHQYRADPGAAGVATGKRYTVHATREVILSAGAFNTPQLLMLSGLGAEPVLKAGGVQALKVNGKDLPGVGKNLQDRYEVGIVSDMGDSLNSVRDCTYGKPGDPCLAKWLKDGSGPYVTNGGILGIVKKSSPSLKDPDLFIFGLPAFFAGYFPHYSDLISDSKTFFTWAVLKAHTGNTAGVVELRKVADGQPADPRDTPYINFHYFDEGTPGAAQADLEAVKVGVDTARAIGAHIADKMTFTESWPQPGTADSPEGVRKFIKDEAWGHHASCTAKIGADSDPDAVLNGDFQVRGTIGLRVVDASVFPKIPGFFIVSAVYMVSEKASDVIEAYAKKHRPETHELVR